MKKFALLVSLIFLVSIGCNGPDITNLPITGEVNMANVAFDSVGSGGSAGGITLVSKTANLSSVALGFSDKDSVRISFSYKNSAGPNDTLFFINTSPATSTRRLYTLRDNSANLSYKSINVTIPSLRVDDFYYYTIRAKGDVPYMVIKDLAVYKK